MDSTPVQEYDYLRSEIMQKIELHNTLLTFTITTTVAILTFALSANITLLYLLPFCVIIPMSMRIAYYKGSIEKLSAYMIVFLETKLDWLNWETRNNMLQKNSTKNKNVFFRLTKIRYYECLILSIVCYGLFAFNYIRGQVININTIIFVLLPILLVLWEVFVTIRVNLEYRSKQAWIERWTTVKEELEQKT